MEIRIFWVETHIIWVRLHIVLVETHIVCVVEYVQSVARCYYNHGYSLVDTSHIGAHILETCNKAIVTKQVERVKTPVYVSP